MRRHDPDRHGDQAGPAPNQDGNALFEETPGLSLAPPIRPDRWLGERIRRLSPLRRGLLGGASALVVAIAGVAFIAATQGRAPAPAPPPPSLPAPLAINDATLPTGCSFSRIDGTHSFAQCVQCDARLSNAYYGLLCHFRDAVVITATRRLAIGCTFLRDGSLSCPTPSPGGSAAPARASAVPSG